jgi:hypothetical protein
MDADRFDTLSRTLSATPSRRAALRVLGVLSLGLIARIRPEPAEAKSGKCKPKCNQCERCKRGDCDKKNGKTRCERGKCKPKANDTPCDGGGTCQRGRCVLPFCAGRNSCQDGNEITTCQASPDALCFCTVTADTAAPFCALNGSGTGEDCLVTPCPPGEMCVDFTGGGCDENPMGGTACALPCPNPL